MTALRMRRALVVFVSAVATASFNQLVVLTGLSALILAWGTAANAAVIYDNNVTVVDTASFSDVAGQFIADDFILAPGKEIITGVQWTGTYGDGFTPTVDNFSIQIFADADSVPALTPFSSLPIGDPGRTNIGKLGGGGDPRFDLFAYSVNIAPIELASNTRFWISIVNDTSADTDDNWAWGGQVIFDNGAIRNSQTDPWFLTGLRQDFRLTGPAAVPEPSALTLFVLGILVFLSYHWYWKSIR